MTAPQLLFVTSNRLGDAILSMGLLAHLIETHPGAEVTVVCGPLSAPLFRSVPGLKQLIAVEKRSYSRHWLDVFARVRGTRWDVLVDLRRVPILRLVRARSRHVWRPSPVTEHKVAENARLLGIAPRTPQIWLDDAGRVEADKLLPKGVPLLGLGPTSASYNKQWAPERFAELARRLTAPEGPLAGAHIAVFGAAHERERITQLLAALPQDRFIDLIGKADVQTVGAVLEKLDLYIGNDSGLMHLAAAVGAPTLGLFGTGSPAVYGPYGPRTAFIERRLPEPERLKWEAADPHTDRRQVMTALNVDDAEAAARALLARLAAETLDRPPQTGP